MRNSKKLLGEDTSMLMLIVSNKMTLYFCIHVAIMATIYTFLGMESVKF